MDLKKRLELGRSGTQTSEIVEYVSGKPKQFKELLEVFMEGRYRQSQTAAMPLNICVKHWPYLIDPHIKTLIKILEHSSTPPAIVRNIIRLFQVFDIPKRYQGPAANLCFRFLLDANAAIAIRVYAMTVLSRISKGNRKWSES